MRFAHDSIIFSIQKFQSKHIQYQKSVPNFGANAIEIIVKIGKIPQFQQKIR